MMECFCEQARELKVDGDIGADPIWCNHCGCNFDLEDIPISNELKKGNCKNWVTIYGEWMD
ncbi:hypothetical protein [Metabacillus sediminilitoris]|uniref:hypothetical protein n=1 Tax=Metabacillus sediminilitoris TaxID=2567941 RepID=UPI001D0DB8FE|nr:hypothetical protein [Metabacillus sediminilitoris]